VKYFDERERELVESVEKDEWISVKEKERMQEQLQDYVHAELKKIKGLISEYLSVT
jgi:hypothetical protein